MAFEKYENLYSDYSTDGGITLKPKKDAATFRFNKVADSHKKYKLFVTGSTQLFYMWRDEINGTKHYNWLVDCLDTEHANKAQYCLNVSKKRPDVTWYAYKKITWKPRLTYLDLKPVGTEWTVGIWAKTKNLMFSDGGYVKISFRVHEKKQGVSNLDATLPIVEECSVTLSEGDCEWAKLTEKIEISEENTAFVGVLIEGYNYTGEVYLERPFLTNCNGFNVLPDFTLPVPGKDVFNWAAIGLSKKEWVDIRVELNGVTIHNDPIFDRIHMFSEWEIDLPTDLLSGENTLTFHLLSDYHDALPYTIREISLIEQPGEKINIIATPNVAKAYSQSFILVKTFEDNLRIDIEYQDKNISGEKSVLLKDKGLNVIKINCLKPCNGARFKLSCEDCVAEGSIKEIVYQEGDRVVTGTGDIIYVRDIEKDVEEFLCWYISNDIGSLVTFRPIYRWSGIRKLNLSLYQKTTKLFNELGIEYAFIHEGRDVEDMLCMPTPQEIDGANFLGRQFHEKDGHIFYFGKASARGAVGTQNADLVLIKYQRDPSHSMAAHSSLSRCYVNDELWSYYNPKMERDVKVAFTYWKDYLNKIRTADDASRHTGPTIQYRLFAAAGFQFVGSETVYISCDPALSFLRGTALCYRLKSTGVHIPLQWYSAPMDCEQFFYRYRLSLYLSYMTGVNEINTEEGLWHMEEYYTHYNRFSRALTEDLKQQTDFNYYIKTHTRSGKFYTPNAFIQGAYEPWNGTPNHQPWGWPDKRCGEAERSWNLLKAIYPKMKFADWLYRKYDCPTDDDPGYFSGTPLGNVDVLPIECDNEVFNNYKFMSFIGYNCMEEDYARTLTKFVENGGTLLMTLAHLTTTTNYDDICNYNLSFEEKRSFGILLGEVQFVSDSVDGKKVEICANVKQPNSVIKYSDNGNIAICTYKIGAGTIIFFNTKAYPSNVAIQPLYEEILKANCTQAVESENVWAKAGNDVSFAVYNQEDFSKHVYFLAVDWYNDVNELRKATLKVNGYDYEIKVPFGVLVKGVVNEGLAVLCNSENGEVMSVGKDSYVAHGNGEVSFTICKDGKMTERTVTFSDRVLKTIDF